VYGLIRGETLLKTSLTIVQNLRTKDGFNSRAQCGNRDKKQSDSTILPFIRFKRPFWK
jgi:hypothetical protein